MFWISLWIEEILTSVEIFMGWGDLHGMGRSIWVFGVERPLEGKEKVPLRHLQFLPCMLLKYTCEDIDFVYFSCNILCCV